MKRLGIMLFILSMSLVGQAFADDLDPLPSMWQADHEWVPNEAPVFNKPNSVEKIRISTASSIQTAAVNGRGRVAVVVDSDIYGQITPEILTYNDDLTIDGFTPELVVFSGNAEYLRNTLIGMYNDQEGLVGAVFVGQIPYIIFEMYQNWGSGDEYTNFASDLFFMDMDGTWTDSTTNNRILPDNGMYDVWNDSNGIEIWVSRIKGDNLPLIGSEVDLLRSYFARNHALRGNILNDTFTALAYPDDDWSGMGPGDKNALDCVYDRDMIEMINAPDQTTAADYKANRLTNDYQLIMIRSHGWHGGHSYASVGDYAAIDPQANFWSLFVCSGCDFTKSNCLGVVTTMNPEGQGLLTWGSTKTGGMMWDYDLYNRVSQGYCVGEGFRYWYNRRLGWEGIARWMWGMVLLGDGSLAVAKPHYDFEVTPWSKAEFTGLEFTSATPDSKTYTIENNSDHAIDWSADTGCDWIAASPAAGTVESGQSVQVAISIIPDNMAAGEYAQMVQFINETDATFMEREVRTSFETRKMLGYWKFDETSGTTAYDSSGNGKDGKCVGENLSFDNSSVAGKFGNALNLGGPTAAESVSVSGLDFASNTVTIAGWIKRNGNQNGYTAIVSNRSSGAANLNFRYNNTLGYHWNNQHYNWNSGLVVPDNKWTFVALVIEPGKATMYMHDGTFKSATNYTSHSPATFAGTTAIGKDNQSSTDRYFKGAIDDMRIYNFAMTSADIQKLAAGVYSWCLSPADSASDVPANTKLTWIGGPACSQYDVYLGTDKQAVADATVDSPEYIGRQTPESYSFAAEPFRTYYWRIDSVNAGGQVFKGNIWSFTTCGGVTRQVWYNIEGNYTFNLTDSANYPYNPDETGHLTSFEGPTDIAENYGSRIHGFLKPKTSGNYRFWIAGDDCCELWISNGTSVSNATKRAYVNGWTGSREWTKYASQTSSQLYLEAGKLYYICALHKEGGGGDHIAVAWQGPDCPTRDIISGEFLYPFEVLALNQYPKVNGTVLPESAEGSSYTASLKPLVSDPGQNHCLTYTMVSGPSWISIAEDGSVSGTPADGDTGENSLTVHVKDCYGATTQGIFKVNVANRFTGVNGMSDYAGFAADWFTTSAESDLNGDGTVDIKDLAIFCDRWIGSGE